MNSPQRILKVARLWPNWCFEWKEPKIDELSEEPCPPLSQPRAVVPGSTLYAIRCVGELHSRLYFDELTNGCVFWPFMLKGEEASRKSIWITISYTPIRHFYTASLRTLMEWIIPFVTAWFSFSFAPSAAKARDNSTSVKTQKALWNGELIDHVVWIQYHPSYRHRIFILRVRYILHIW